MNKTQVVVLISYVALLVVCASILIMGANIDSFDPQKELIQVGKDGFKTVLGALLGSMSMLIGRGARG